MTGKTNAYGGGWESIIPSTFFVVLESYGAEATYYCIDNQDAECSGSISSGGTAEICVHEGTVLMITATASVYFGTGDYTTPRLTRIVNEYDHSTVYAISVNAVFEAGSVLSIIGDN